ncbi:MAG: VOC family protein [Candidatus Pristimantibacillus sp.]
MLHHVELYVSDLKKTEELWGWLLKELEYVVYQKWDHGVSYKYDTTYIVFVQAELKHMDIPYHRGRVGLNHLAFHAKSKEQIDQITLELERKAINILYLDKHPYAGGEDHYAVYFEDPDQIKVELVAPLEL